MNERVIALVVSYNGGEQLASTVAALLTQVEKIVILDNDSNTESKKTISELKLLPDVELLQFEANMGIGYALNKGIEIAIREKFGWVLTMDQDSTSMPEMVKEMLTASRAFNKAKVVCPTLILNDLKESNGEDCVVQYSITSGNLINTDVFEKVGSFNEQYFIDSVDFEFCLKLNNNNISIVRSGKAKMVHRLGEAVSIDLVIFKYLYTKHNPLRRYYIFRNHLYLINDFWKSHKLFLLKKTVFLARDFLLMLAFDKERSANLRMCILGVADFFANKSGKFNERRRILVKPDVN